MPAAGTPPSWPWGGASEPTGLATFTLWIRGDGDLDEALSLGLVGDDASDVRSRLREVALGVARMRENARVAPNSGPVNPTEPVVYIQVELGADGLGGYSTGRLAAPDELLRPFGELMDELLRRLET